MTTVCIVGDTSVDIRSELLSRETAQEALSQYSLTTPWSNTIAVDTASLGMAVSLLNDLNWYLVRFAERSMVKEPSVSSDEWISRSLASAIREGEVAPEESDRNLAIFGVDRGQLVEPMFVTRRPGAAVPEYDLRPVSETVRVRIAADEFGNW